MTRIYVASLSDYNNGTLHGVWIDANQGVNHIEDEVRAMLAESKQPDAEEWAIHDYEGFGGIKLSEWEDFATVAALADAIELHGNAFAAFYDVNPEPLADAVERFEEAYQGEFESVTAYAEDFVESTGMLHGVNEAVARYFDYESFGRDMELGGDIWTHDTPTGCHVFLNF